MKYKYNYLSNNIIGFISETKLNIIKDIKEVKKMAIDVKYT